MSGTSTEAYFENSGPCAPRFGQAGVKGKEPGHSAKSHLTASALLKVLRGAFHDQESVLGPAWQEADILLGGRAYGLGMLLVYFEGGVDEPGWIGLLPYACSLLKAAIHCSRVCAESAQSNLTGKGSEARAAR